MYSGPMRLAHRGNVQRAPENTMESIQAAFRGGFEGAEIDIRLTRDRRLILAHDEHVTHITGGGPDDGCNWNYRQRDWDELKGLAIPYANHLLPSFPEGGISEAELSRLIELRRVGTDVEQFVTDQRTNDPRIAHPVLFDDVLKWIVHQSRRFLLEVECKETGLAVPLMQAFRDIGGSDRCILFSGEPEVVRELAGAFPPISRPEGLRIGANIRRNAREWRGASAELHLDVVDLNAFEVERQEVEELTSSGLWVLSNLGDLPAWWDTLNEWSFKGFKTNFPEAYTEWWSKSSWGRGLSGQR